MGKPEARIKPKSKPKGFKKREKKRLQKAQNPKPKNGLTVILRDPVSNPCCPHGPTILMSQKFKDTVKRFYVCSAERERKFCPFYLTEGNSSKSSEVWVQKTSEYLKGIHHRNMFMILNEIKLLKPSERIFCFTCSSFILKNVEQHKDHKILKEITDDQLMCPTEILPPCEIDKREAQYWFSKSTVEDMVQIFEALKYKFVFCSII